MPWTLRSCPPPCAVLSILILKTIGNRKGDCAWSCSRWQTQPEKICKSQRTNQCHSLRTLYWFVRCDLQIFSGCVCHLEQLHAQSPFLFPIVFSINLIPFFDICSVDYLLFFHPGCSGMCCFTWAAALSQQYTLLFVVLAAGILRFAAGCHALDRLNHGRLERSSAKLLVFYASTRSSCLYWTRRSAKLLVFTIMHSNTRQALRVDAFGLREMVLGKSRQAHQRTIMHSNTRTRIRRVLLVEAPSFLSLQSCTRTLDWLYASTRSVYAKWYWVNHGRLTSEQSCTRTLEHEMVLGKSRQDNHALEHKSRQAHQRTIMHSNTRTRKFNGTG